MLTPLVSDPSGEEKKCQRTAWNMLTTGETKVRRWCASLGMLTPLVLVCFVGCADPSGERIKEPLVNGSRKTRQNR